MSTTQALVPVSTSSGKNGDAISSVNTKAPSSALKNTSAPKPLTDELVAEILKGRGLRGWLRLARVARVLGLFTLYLFLDTYDIRADFNRRMVERLHEETKPNNLIARIKAHARYFVHSTGDKFIRLLRLLVFHGHEGSDNKAARLEKQAAWLSHSLISLGPTFIKIGQALGTRADLLPLAYVKELATLQDQVPAFPTAEAFARIEAELGRSLQECYAEIDSEPVASASLGQVYRARLATGQEVAVKVQRPNLEQTISFDVAILYKIVKLTNRFFPRANENADWEGMLREFHSTIFEEMDYVKEGRNADRFRYNFRTWQVIRVPKIYWSQQIAKIKGARVVGIAGGPDKCRYLVDQLGFDAAIDYKSQDVKKALAELCPKGIDVFFDNVGGDILDAALSNLARGARVVICGAISQYNNTTPVKGPANYLSLLVNRATMTGIVVGDYFPRAGEAVREMAGWVAAGKLKTREDVVEGLETFPQALMKLFKGENNGKLVLKVA